MAKGDLIKARQELNEERTARARSIATSTSTKRQVIADFKKKTTLEAMKAPGFQTQFVELLANGTTIKAALDVFGLNYDKYYRYRQRDPNFAAKCDEARDCGFDAMADECVRIADEPVTTKTDILRAKLRIETRIELLSRWSRRYSNRQQVEVNDNREVEKTLRERFAKRLNAAPDDKKGTE